MNDLFQTLGESIQQIIDAIRQVGTSDKVAELSILFSIIITLVIMYKGYEVLMGRSQSPIRELTFDIAGKLLAITFALNIGGWLDGTISAMDGIYEWAGGGTKMYQNLDEMFANTTKLADTIWAKTSILKAPIGLAAMVLCYIGFIVAVVPTLSILIVTTFTQTLLVITAPIVFWLLIFKSTKNVFTQYIGLLLSNTLVILLVGLFLKVFMNQISTWINYFIKETQTGAEVLGTGIFYVIASLILSTMIIAAKTFAEKIAHVSMESAMDGVMNPAGRLAGKALGYGAGKAANLASPLASMAGNYAAGVAKDIGAGAKLMGSGGYSFAKKCMRG